MNFETQTEVNLVDYLKMIELKTAALIGGAIKMGALIGNATPKDIGHIEDFGRNIGIAFQLQDDILDTYGDPKKFGKKVGGDIIQNKKTFLVLRSLELADASTRSVLQELMNTPTKDEKEKIERVTSIFTKVGIEALAEDKKNEYLKLGFDALHKVDIPRYRKEAIITLAKKLTDREI
jgi:geranylgeranyl diphosphate synthase type II